jgi:serine phosphatase RsbU (regulator of sigma subunit)
MSLFHPHSVDPVPATTEPVATVFPAIEGAEIAAVFVGQRVAGDFYDSLRVGPQRILFGLLDVAGRGDENRSILGTAQQIFRSGGVELFAGEDINESDAMTELSLRINRALIATSKTVHPCPAFIGCYHEKFGTLCYTNAAHTPGLLRDSTSITELASTGLPLGLFSHATSDAPTIGLPKGAALVLVSRGVISCPGRHEKSGEEFGLERVKQLLLAAPVSGAADLCTSVLHAADAFGGEGPRCDDRTALALVRTT